MGNLPLSEKEEAVQKIKNLLKEKFNSNAPFLVEKDGRIELQHLWHKKELLNSSLKLIEKFLDENDLLKECTAIAIPETVKSQFSIFPHACILSNKHNKNLYIWKENAGYLGGKEFSILFGEHHIGREPESVLIIQNIIYGGYTIVEMIEHFYRIQREHNRQIKNIKIAILVNLANEEQTNNMITLINQVARNFNITKNNFKYMIEISELWHKAFPHDHRFSLTN